MSQELSVIDIRKDLMKSRPVAKLIKIIACNMYYSVEILGIIYQFPISGTDPFNMVEFLKGREIEDLDNPQDPINLDENELPSVVTLSADLGSTDFYPEMPASELSRWIIKAFSSGELIPVK